MTNSKQVALLQQGVCSQLIIYGIYTCNRGLTVNPMIT